MESIKVVDGENNIYRPNPKKPEVGGGAGGGGGARLIRNLSS